MFHDSHRHPVTGQIGLGVGDGVFPIVKNAGGQGGAGGAFHEGRSQMLGRPGASGGDQRDLDSVGHGSRHGQIITVLGAVGIHAGQNNLTGPQTLDLAGPAHRLQPRRHPAAVDVNLPDLLTVAVHPLRVDVHHNALAAEPPGRLAHEIRVAHRRRVDRNLVGPGVQQGADVVQGLDPPADGHRHEADLGRPAHHVEQDRPLLVAGGDVQKNQLVGPFLLIPRGHFHRVARVSQVHEVRSLHHPPGMHVEAGNDPFGQHQGVSGRHFENREWTDPILSDGASPS